MALGYDGKLYILAFDHRGSFQKKMFGIEGDPTPEQTETISDAKQLIFEGMLEATQRGAEAGAPACSSTSSSAPTSRPVHTTQGLKLAMPVEKSGQNEFDFEYGDDFGAHIEKFNPDFSKVLVRYNPEDTDEDMNERQLGRLKRLSDWLHDERPQVPVRAAGAGHRRAARVVDGNTDRYDAELRPELMRRAIEAIQNAGIEVDVWKIEGVDERDDAADAGRAGPRRRGARGRQVRAARSRRLDREGRPLARAGRPGRGLHRLRDRPLDLVGRAQGLPRQTLEREAAASQIADNYLHFVQVYEGQGVH